MKIHKRLRLNCAPPVPSHVGVKTSGDSSTPPSPRTLTPVSARGLQKKSTSEAISHPGHLGSRIHRKFHRFEPFLQNARNSPNLQGSNT